MKNEKMNCEEATASKALVCTQQPLNLTPEFLQKVWLNCKIKDELHKEVRLAEIKNFANFMRPILKEYDDLRSFDYIIKSGNSSNFEEAIDFVAMIFSRNKEDTSKEGMEIKARCHQFYTTIDKYRPPAKPKFLRR